jgi:hypothetical protein
MTPTQIEELLKKAVDKIDDLRVMSLKEGNENFESLLYEIQQDIFKAMDGLAPSPSIEGVEEDKGLQWIKASERLPDGKGKSNKVVIRCIHPQMGFIAEGFRNFSESHPALYMEVGALSFLTVKGKGDFHSTVDIDLIEWLEEPVKGED